MRRLHGGRRSAGSACRSCRRGTHSPPGREGKGKRKTQRKDKDYQALSPSPSLSRPKQTGMHPTLASRSGHATLCSTFPTTCRLELPSPSCARRDILPVPRRPERPSKFKDNAARQQHESGAAASSTGGFYTNVQYENTFPKELHEQYIRSTASCFFFFPAYAAFYGVGVTDAGGRVNHPTG